ALGARFPVAADPTRRVRSATAAARGGLRPLPAEGVARLKGYLSDGPVVRSARQALARHARDGARPLGRVGGMYPLLPVELHGQGPAVRAFLHRWHLWLPDLDAPEAGRMHPPRALDGLSSPLGSG